MNELVKRWLERDPDPRTREELHLLLEENCSEEISNRFKGRLEFGTAGLRGVIGAGPNRMNRLVIQETAVGLGNYLLKTQSSAASKGVVIGYDGRPDSKQFAVDTASALVALGIKVYLTHDVAATPIVAFGVLHLAAAAAVVITASHNPPEYNGFKVYWENGAQIIPPHDSGIASEIDTAAESQLNLMPLEEAEQKGLLVWLKNDYYQAYRKAICNNPLLRKAPHSHNLSLAYTAMHGVGAKMAEDLLADSGFAHVYSVAEQREPNGLFPTVNFPNPEEKGAMDMVIAEAKRHNADLACANDPDADRFAVAAKKPSGEYQMLTGDQVGVLLGYYLLNQAQDNQKLVGATIVSSSLLKKVAENAGGYFYKTLTGFKWLTNVAMQEQTDKKQFLFAYEEALGYTVGSSVWDKDGLSALVFFAELASSLKNEGKTVWEQLEAIYRQHGMYINAQHSIVLDPSAPPIGDALRSNPPATIAGQTVVSVEDFKLSKQVFANGTEQALYFPQSDVLIYHLNNGSRVVVRPSGTEPKLKCYYEVIEPFSVKDSFDQALNRAEEKIDMLISEHQHALETM